MWQNIAFCIITVALGMSNSQYTCGYYKENTIATTNTTLTSAISNKAAKAEKQQQFQSETNERAKSLYNNITK